MADRVESAEQPKPKLFRVSSLQLDLTNPRFEDPAESQREAINRMINLDKNKLYALAASIMATGHLNPTELPMVVKERRKNVVVEGNRRLTCLKLLLDPSLSDDRNAKRRFEQLASGSSHPVPLQMLCTPFGGREEANPWIHLRHTGSNDGVGVSGWSSAQAGRFSARQGRRRRREEQFVDCIRTAYSGDTELLDALRLVQESQYTTLGRLLITSEVVHAMGLHVKDGEMHLVANPDDARGLILKVLQDLSTPRDTKSGQKSWSRQLNHKQDRVDYIMAFKSMHPEIDPRRVPKIGQPVGEAVAVTSESPARSSAAAGIPNEPAYTAPPPSIPHRGMSVEQYLFSSVDFSGFNPRLQQLGLNASRVRLDPTFDVAGILARVVVELCTMEFLERHQIAPRKALWQDIRSALTRLDPEVQDEHRARRELHLVFRSIDQGTKGLAVRSMHDFVHDTIATPGPSEVRHISQLFTPFLQSMSANLRSGHPGNRRA
ncbi:hypothetical protein ACIPWF_22615 [Paenarthrobacter sp. NPDC089989]|uniref:hypothetical protein n=1 Tax=unclassified Paenarthrobacter TaxID=2634190 RepID=UPI003816612C